MKLALFDFDGTITTKDSLIQFIKYAVGPRKFYFGMAKLLWTLIQYKLGFLPNYLAKERLISLFFAGWEYKDFQKIGDKYSTHQIDKITKVEAMERIAWHKSEGHKVVVVSASMENWLKAWCDRNGLDLIGTKLEIVSDKLTGKFSTKNCYGIEKVNRLKETFELDQFDYIYAYGDSTGDKELLEVADQKFFRSFTNPRYKI